jgi:hypothetical protein
MNLIYLSTSQDTMLRTIVIIKKKRKNKQTSMIENVVAKHIKLVIVES